MITEEMKSQAEKLGLDLVTVSPSIGPLIVGEHKYTRYDHPSYTPSKVTAWERKTNRYVRW